MPKRLHPLLAVLALCPLACTTVADASDTTPPALYFKYRVGEGSTWVSVASGGTEISVDRDDVLHLYACAEDDGGVFLCAINGGGHLKCTSSPAGGGIGSITEGTYSFYDESRSSASDGESTNSSRTVVVSIEMADVCDEGHAGGSALEYTAIGYNFNTWGISNSGKLTVNVD